MQPAISRTTARGFAIADALPDELAKPVDEWCPGDWLYKSVNDQWMVSKIGGYDIRPGAAFNFWVVFVGDKLKPYPHSDMSEWRVYEGDGLTEDEINVLVERELKTAFAAWRDNPPFVPQYMSPLISTTMSTWRLSNEAKQIEKEARKRYGSYKQRTSKRRAG